MTVHLPYGFSSIKLQAVTAAGAQFGPPGFETDLLYRACLAALVLGGSGPLSIEGLLAKRREIARPCRALEPSWDPARSGLAGYSGTNREVRGNRAIRTAVKVRQRVTSSA